MTDAPFKGPFTVKHHSDTEMVDHYWAEDAAGRRIRGLDLAGAQWLCDHLNAPAVDAKSAAEKIVADARRPEWGKDAHRDIEHVAAILSHLPRPSVEMSDSEREAIYTARDLVDRQVMAMPSLTKILLAIITRRSTPSGQQEKP
jgi:hypothetical protein